MGALPPNVPPWLRAWEAIVKFEFPLQRQSLAVKSQQRLSTDHKMQKLFSSLQ